jgi:predicted aminopeptidase
MDQVLNDPTLDPQTRGKLELVVQARSFAARDLQLDVGNSYTSFSQLDRDTLAFVLSASPFDRLAAHTWWFPIVGRVPYKGFFSLEAAEKERRKLEDDNFDTYLRTTSAFSTLGWLPDPLLSTVLRQDSVGLVETVIHEVTHNTLFVSGHVKFNESFANFVGAVGAIEFYCGRGNDARLCKSARDSWHDTVLLSQYLDQLWTDLESLYEIQLPLDSLRPRRENLMSESAQNFQADYAPRMRTPGFQRYDPTRLNNARLVAQHLYYHRLPLFQRLYEQAGSLAAAIDRVGQAVEGTDEPWGAVERSLDSGVAP